MLKIQGKDGEDQNWCGHFKENQKAGPGIKRKFEDATVLVFEGDEIKKEIPL